jgi:hypothetical protein
VHPRCYYAEPRLVHEGVTVYAELLRLRCSHAKPSCRCLRYAPRALLVSPSGLLACGLAAPAPLAYCDAMPPCLTCPASRASELLGFGRFGSSTSRHAPMPHPCAHVLVLPLPTGATRPYPLELACAFFPIRAQH